MIDTIVKVQLSIPDRSEVLVYTKDKDHFYSGVATRAIKEVLGREYKRYFYARVPKKRGMIKLLDRAPDQNW